MYFRRWPHGVYMRYPPRQAPVDIAYPIPGSHDHDDQDHMYIDAPFLLVGTAGIEPADGALSPCLAAYA